MSTPRLALLSALALTLPQSTPTGGAITKFVPPVPTPASFISDQRRVLSDSAHRSLHARIAAIQRDGLGDVAVAIIPSIGDYSANQVAVEIYRTWRVGSVAPIGSARRNVGVLLLIVPKELSPNNRGECWINTGTGAEGLITDATAAAICRNAIIPHLRNRDYAAAIAAGIGSIENRLRGGGGAQAVAPSAPEVTRSRGSVVWLAIGAFTATPLAGLFGFFRYRRNRPRKCKQCGRQMTRLDEKADNAKLLAGQVVEEQIGSVDYDVWLCECGEFTVIPYRRWFTSYSKCRECKRITASSKRRTIFRATYVSTGLAEETFTCKACRATWTNKIILPQLVRSSSSSGGGRSGGGSSFGGSGSTSGGGGGSSY